MQNGWRLHHDNVNLVKLFCNALVLLRCKTTGGADVCFRRPSLRFRLATERGVSENFTLQKKPARATQDGLKPPPHKTFRRPTQSGTHHPAGRISPESRTCSPPSRRVVSHPLRLYSERHNRHPASQLKNGANTMKFIQIYPDRRTWHATCDKSRDSRQNNPTDHIGERRQNQREDLNLILTDDTLHRSCPATYYILGHEQSAAQQTVYTSDGFWEVQSAAMILQPPEKLSLSSLNNSMN